VQAREGYVVTDLETFAVFLVMCEYDREQVIAGLKLQHPFETEDDMHAAYEVAVSYRTQFQRDLSLALNREAVREEHRA
jgi:hypothetical protein